MLLYLPLRFCRLNRRPARGAQYFTGARILLGFGFLCLCLTVETALSSELYRYQDYGFRNAQLDAVELQSTSAVKRDLLALHIGNSLASNAFFRLVIIIFSKVKIKVVTG